MGLEPTLSDVTGQRFNQFKLHLLLFSNRDLLGFTKDMSTAKIFPQKTERNSCFSKKSLLKKVKMFSMKAEMFNATLFFGF